jgi:hypothetical protein
LNLHHNLPSLHAQHQRLLAAAGVSDSTRLIPDPEIRRRWNWSRKIISSDGQ